MKKLQKHLKLKLNRETLTRLDQVVAGAIVKTVDATACVTNCAGCPTYRLC